MRVSGERVKRMRLIQTERYVVAVEVEMVIPPDDPSEPCYEPETVKLLREVHEHAERGDVAWLRQKGKVYVVRAGDFHPAHAPIRLLIRIRQKLHGALSSGGRSA